MTRAFVFPGQGSQSVGMGREIADAFPAARHLLEEVDDALDQHLSKLMFEGPESDLTLTENAQPAIMATSLAALRVLETEGDLTVSSVAGFVAGHSLGEYSALCAAGSIGVADAARLLKTRGRAMQTAVPVGEGAMAALLGLDLETVTAISEEAAADEVCTPANDNAPGQIVVSGNTGAVERAVVLAGERGAKRSIMLPVSAPFHCALMAPAAAVMREALAMSDIGPPSPPLVANITAATVEDADTIRELLFKQVTGRVRWRECVIFMREHGVEEQIEVGAGRVLSGLARRIDRDIGAISVEGPADVEAFLTSI